MYMLGAKYGFAQSMDYTAQTMDPYFARAIHGLHVHVLTSQLISYLNFILLNILKLFLFFIGARAWLA